MSMTDRFSEYWTARRERSAMCRCRGWAAACLLVPLLVGCASPRPGTLPSAVSRSAFDLGPLATRDQTLDGNERLRAVGPFYESQQTKEGQSFHALRPIYSSFSDPERDEARREILWPVGMVRDFRNQRYWLFLAAFGHDYDRSCDKSRYRTVILPVVFNGRDANGNDYFAVFPFGGTIREFVGRDEIRFVLFPVWCKTVVRDVETQSVLWPIFSYTRGDDVLRYRVFPLYGRSVNEGRWEKSFVLWPIWNSARYTYPESSGRTFMLFPIFGRVNLTDQKGWMILPPLFQWIEGEKQSVLSCPWPFFQYARGEVDRLSIWPVWGTETWRAPRLGSGESSAVPTLRSTFFCWPLGRYETMLRGNKTVSRIWFLPFVYHVKCVVQGTPSPRQDSATDTAPCPSENRTDTSTLCAKTEPQVIAREFKLWPFCSYRHANGKSRVRVLELWPSRDLEPVERNIAPFWSIYSRRRDGEAVEDEFFWGLVRRRRKGDEQRGFSIFPLFTWQRQEDRSEWSVLYGLLGCSREDAGRRYRVLYLFFSKKPRDEL